MLTLKCRGEELSTESVFISEKGQYGTKSQNQIWCLCAFVAKFLCVFAPSASNK